MAYLRCTGCGRGYSGDEIIYYCDGCGSLLEVAYDYEAIKGRVSKSALEKRSVRSMWRYGEFLPADPSRAVSLGEGFTGLVKAGRLGRDLRLANLYFKLEFTCPTGSFKDRGSSLLISKAVEHRAKAVAIDSSGNAAASLAAYAARAGMPCYVFAPAYASSGKLAQALASEAVVVKVEGTREDAFEAARLAYERYGFYYCGFQVNPYASEGLKTIAYEICEQLDWKPPRWMIFPVGTGSALIGCWKGFTELHELGWIDELPSLICIQPEGCAPIVEAYAKGAYAVTPITNPRTVAEGLMIGNPLRAKPILEAIRRSRGLAEAVTDAEILAAGRTLAKTEGFFVEPSAAASVAGLMKLLGKGAIDRGGDVVCILTGSGLKAVEAYPGLLEKVVTIPPSLDGLETALGSPPTLMRF